MKAAAARRPEAVDSVVAVIGVCVLGMGVVTGLAGAAAAAPVLALTGAAAIAIALALILAAEWLPSLPLLALTLPLPGYATASLRIPAAAVVTAIVLFAWALGRVAPADRPVRNVALRTPTLALFAAIALAAAFANARAAAARELLNFGLLLALLAVAVHLLAAEPRRIRTLARTIAVVAGAAGLLAGLQAIGALPGRFPLTGTSFHRATLGFGWPNELGVFFAVSLPLCWYVHRSSGTATNRLLTAAGLALAGIGLAATFSRGAWLAFVVSSTVLLFAGGARLVLRIVLGTFIVVAAVDLATGGLLTGRLLSLADDPYVVQRAALMLVGVLMFRANPIVGVGPGGFTEHLEEYGPGVPWLWDYVGSAHNAYLEIAAEAGLLGLGALLWFLAAHLRVLLRGARRQRPATVTRGPETAGDPSGGPDPVRPDDGDVHLMRALLWSFACACLACLTIWPFAHGVGQLIMLVTAMGVVQARSTRRVPEGS